MSERWRLGADYDKPCPTIETEAGAWVAELRWEQTGLGSNAHLDNGEEHARELALAQEITNWHNGVIQSNDL